MKTLLALALGAVLAEPAAAQGPARIVGRVLDAVSQAPVPDAEIRTGELVTTSGANGSFVLGSVPPGRAELRVRRIGYAPLRHTIELVPGLDQIVSLALIPAPVRLDSVTATAAPAAIAIDGPDLVRRGADLARALDGWEGVVVRRGGNGPAAPQVRGGGPDETLVLVDGFPINDPLTGRADLSRISSREVEEVTLIPGAQTVRAGARAVSGLILVETRRDLRPEGSSWAGSHSALGARLGGSTGALTASLSGERLASDYPYTIPVVRGGGEGIRLNAGGEQYAASLTYGGPIDVVLRGSLASHGLPGTTTNPTPSAHGQDRSLLLGARGGGPLELSGSVQWLETRASDPSPPTGAAYDASTHGLGATLALGHHLPVALRGWRGSLGLIAEGRTDRFGGDGVRSGASFTQGAWRAEARVSRGTTTMWSVAPAVRLDVWTGSTTPRASARVDGGWSRGPTSITLGFGSAVTPPVLADLFFREGVGVRLNPNLRPERVRWELEGGLRRHLSGVATLGIRAFVGRVADMTVWAPDFRFIWSPGNFDVVRRGGEITGEWTPARELRLSGSATYAAVTYDIPDGAQVLYRPRITAETVVVWSPGPWTTDLRWHHIGERFPNSAGTNPRAPFSLLDVGVERRVGRGLTLRGDVRDLADVRAEFLAGYPTPGRSVALTFTLVAP